MASQAWYRDTTAAIARIFRRIDQIGARMARPRRRDQMRLAITVRDPENDSYPTEGEDPDTYFIVFIDGSFPTGVDGLQPHTLRYRQELDEAKTTAHSIGDEYVPLYSLIRVSIHNGQWWFDRGGSTQTISSSGSGSGSSGSGSSSAETPSTGSSSAGETCVTIPGVDLESLPVADDPPLLLGIDANGCLVAVVNCCIADSSSGE